MSRCHGPFIRRVLSIAAVFAGGSLLAQNSNEEVVEMEAFKVSGYRSALADSLDAKRQSD